MHSFKVLFLAGITLLSTSSFAGSMDDTSLLLQPYLGSYSLVSGDAGCKQELIIQQSDRLKSVNIQINDEFFAGIDLSGVNSGAIEPSGHGVDPDARVSVNEELLAVSLRGKRYCYIDVIAVPCGYVRLDATFQLEMPSAMVLNFRSGFFKTTTCHYNRD